jgi:predicted N-acyltransferase
VLKASSAVVKNYLATKKDGMDTEYDSEIYESIKNIDLQEWQSLIDLSHDLAMDQRLIHLLEKSLSDQARFWTLVIRDRQQQIIACACLSLFQTDIVQSVSGRLRNWINRLRDYWPNALKLKVLFCGLPLPSAHSHLRVREGVDLQLVLRKINGVMTQLAQQEKATLLVFKEFTVSQDTQVTDLKKMGFIRGELEPVYQLPGIFKDFANYQESLRASFRRQIQSNIKKFKESGLKVEHFANPEEIYSRFSEPVHRLYLNVWEKAKEKLECFPVDFFREIATHMPGQVFFTLISDQEKPVAFALGLTNEEAYHNLYVGLDYSYNKNSDLYFNLFYHELDAIFKCNKKQIFLGQTSGTFKTRIGATADPRFFWVRSLNPLLQLIFKYFRSIIFPKMPAPATLQVFKKMNPEPCE